MSAVLLSAAVIFIAELGDKSQLMCMTFATRYRARTVVIGAVAASAVLDLASALAGDVIGDALPRDGVRIASGIVFLLFALLALREGQIDEDEARPVAKGGRAVLVVAIAFALSELGDKTMVTTMTLSTQYSWPAVWAGATLAMAASIVLAVLVGRALLRVVPLRIVHLVSAGLFAAVGVVLLIG